ncbi:hypothetical protein [Morganella morganii]|uniref:hypothetical protein n=1 Tax=Morganella morganii TaxID=582 RepID=UPI001FFD4517|nr:hypothetical protein [Morganella morganii]
MKDRIKFSDEMLAAVIGGRKTQTRRLMKPQPVLNGNFYEVFGAGWSKGIKRVTVAPGHSLERNFPYGLVDKKILFADKDGNIKGEIEIVDVWLQQVQDITLGDICKEIGCGLYDFIPATYGFEVWEKLWKSIYGEETWQTNPWVWVIEFRCIKK